MALLLSREALALLPLQVTSHAPAEACAFHQTRLQCLVSLHWTDAVWFITGDGPRLIFALHSGMGSHMSYVWSYHKFQNREKQILLRHVRNGPWVC